MKTVFGIGLILLGIVSLSRYQGLGDDLAETLGALLAAFVISFLPGILLIRSDNKAKTKQS